MVTAQQIQAPITRTGNLSLIHPYSPQWENITKPLSSDFYTCTVALVCKINKLKGKVVARMNEFWQSPGADLE